MSSSADLFNQDIWQCIMRQLSQTERATASLINTKAHAAAVVANDSLVVAPWSLFGADQHPEQAQAQAESLMSYLQHHGRHVLNLEVSFYAEQTVLPEWTQLPCPHLQSLKVAGTGCKLHLSLLHARTALTRLDLEACRLVGDGGVPPVLSHLTAVGGVQDLTLAGLSQINPVSSWVTFPSEVVLPSLTHLTRLNLSRVVIEDVHQISVLSNLHTLVVVAPVLASGQLKLGPTIAPGFVLPNTLQSISLASFVALDPTVLTVSLSRLSLSGTTIEGHGGMSNGVALLSAISHLTMLEALELRNVDVEWPSASSAYAALTASSKLRSLVVHCYTLPVDAWRHVFPQGRVCGSCESLITDHNHHWSVEGVSSMVRCLTGLRELHIGVRDAAAAAALYPLKLTQLWLVVRWSSQADAEACIRALAALTSLCTLSFELLPSYQFVSSRDNMLPLLALTRLTHLCMILPPFYRLTNKVSQCACVCGGGGGRRRQPSSGRAD